MESHAPLPKRRTKRSSTAFRLTGLALTVTALVATFTGAFAAGPYNVQVADRTGFASVTLDDGAIVQYIGDNNTSFGAAGSGVFDSFVRVQNDPTERGYNTDGTLQFDTKAGAFTHSIRLSEIPTVIVGGQIYWEFFADINDSDSTPQISLDAFELYLTSNPNVTGYPFAGPAPNVATKIYDFGDAEGDVILINDVNQGSGRGDLRYLVPLGGFDVGDCDYGNPACTTYLVLYTEWGGYSETGFNGASDGGFEEWKVKRYPVLRVSKDIAGGYDRTVDWTIEKSVEPTQHDLFAGDSASSEYTVTVTKSEELGSVMVNGTITILGDVKASSKDITATSVDVEINDLFNGLPATITECSVPQNPDGTYTIAAESTVTCDYTLDLAAPVDGTNVARATFKFDEVTLSFQGSADIEAGDFIENLIGVDEINVDDSNGEAWSTGASMTWNYTREFDCSADQADYTDGFLTYDVDNTATIQETDQSSSASVTVNCYAPVVSKDATAEWLQRYDWTISKSVSPDQHDLFAGESATSDYDVVVDQTLTESFRAYGTIWVTNPAGSPGDMDVNVADAVDGSAATVDCGEGSTSLTVEPGTTESCTYSVDLGDNSDRLNTATVTFNSLDFVATADVVFGDPEITGYPEINVTDYFDGDWIGIDLGSASGDKTFEYKRFFECSDVQSDYSDGFYTDTFANVAEIDETGQQADEAVTLNCYAPVVTKTAEAGYLRQQVLWEISKSASPDSHTGFAGDSFTSDYDITVTRLGDPAPAFNADAAGVISVYNPHPTRSLTVSVADEVNQGATIVPATVDCDPGAATSTSLTVAATFTGTCDWNASLGAAGLWTNTATATLTDPDTGAGFTGVKDFSVLIQLENDNVTIDDTNIAGSPDFGPTNVSAVYEYSQDFACPADPSLYDENGRYVESFPNTATIVETEQSDGANVDLTCYIPLIEKTAEGSFTRTFNWEIEKEAFLADGSVVPDEGLTLNDGQSYNLEWQISVDLDSGDPYEDSGFAVSGTITVENPNPNAEMVVALSDLLSDGTPGEIDPTSCNYEAGLLTVAAGGSETCDYSASPSDDGAETNTATATLNDIDFEASAPIEWRMSTANGQVLVTDIFNGGEEQELGSVSAAGVLPQVFTIYTLLSSDPADDPDALLVCGENLITNRADIWSYDGAVRGANLGYDERLVPVTVACELGCTLTQGYWKTHSEFGPAPYDETWALLPDGASTPFFLSGQTWYKVFWTAPKGNAYYNLAHQYMAAKLNELNGASVPGDVAAAMSAAETLLNTYTPAQIDAMKGNSAVRKQFISLAGILGDYNEGIIGPGHCDEDGYSVS